MKRFYRVSNTETNHGLWYDMEGNFTGLIHGKFDFCTNNGLPMPFDEDLIGWISATETLEGLFLWFTKDDIRQLEKFGYKICVFEATEFRQYKNHTVINQASSKFLKFLDLKTILRFEYMKEEIVAFQDLAEQLGLTVGVVKIFSDELLKFNRKRTLRNFKIEKKISDFQTEMMETLYEDGEICNGCDLAGTQCEGSNCDVQVENYFLGLSKSDLQKKAFEVFGDRYYSFSMRIKNQLKR